MNIIAPTQFTFAIMIMALITFTMRYVFFSSIIKFELNAQFKTILLFTAPCVLTAMTIPIMFQDMLASPNSAIASLAHSRYFLASVVAIVLSIFVRQTLVVIGLSMAVFYGLSYVI